VFAGGADKNSHDYRSFLLIPLADARPGMAGPDPTRHGSAATEAGDSVDDVHDDVEAVHVVDDEHVER
jgi:hypothetical protein